jgi:transcriptional regulator GlxA family with amidase domain
MAIWDPPAEIGVLLYPEVAFATVHGATDLFKVADSIARQRMGPTAPILRVSHWQLKSETDAVERVFDTHPQLVNRPVAIIVPGSWEGQPEPDLTRCLAQWLIERHAAGSALCSICGGAIILAATGLLAGRSATTHWDYAEELARRFPDIRVDARRIVIEDGNLMTAGGVLAWTDLGLRLVDRYLGSTIMLETARYMLADPPGREQSYYSSFSPKLNHGDMAVLKVQHWLQAQAAAPRSIAALAEVSGLGERTFLRRFQKATGLKPTEYGQRLRVGKAREMLEFTTQSIDQISWAIGYEDPGSFRRVFRRVVGLTPGDYRRRFAVARRARSASAAE